MGKLAQTDEQLAKIIVDNCEIKIPHVYQNALAKKLGIHSGTLSQIISGKNKGREGVPAAMEAYRLKLAMKPKAELVNKEDMRSMVLRILEKKLQEAETNDDTKEIQSWIKPCIDILKMEHPENSTNININIDNHLSFFIQLVLDYVPLEKHPEVQAKYEEYKKNLGVK